MSGVDKAAIGALQVAIRGLAVSGRTRFRATRELGLPLLALIVLLGLIAALHPGFLSPGPLASFGGEAAPLMIMALGETLVILIGGIDLSIAGMASFSAVLFTQLGSGMGDWAIPVVVVAAIAIGAAQGCLHAYAQIPSFVATLGTQAILYGVTFFMSHGTAQPLTAPSRILDMSAGTTGGIPNSMTLAVILCVLLLAAMRWSRLGRDIYAVGASERAALVGGVDVILLKTGLFAASAVSGALAGLLLLAGTEYSSPGMANNYLLPVVVAVIIGGTSISGGVGSIVGALIGGLIVTGLRMGIVLAGFNPAFQSILFGLVVLAIVTATLDRNKIEVIK